MLFLVHVALAEPREAPSDAEIIVYGDDFARWDGTRWGVEAELVLPSELRLEPEPGHAVITHALQLRAVVACEKDARLSPRRWEVSCEIEDVGLLVTTASDWGSPTRVGRVQDVLDAVDERLTGARIQMQVGEDGGLFDFDLEGLEVHDPAQRASDETLRGLARLLMAGFHLRIPDHAQRDGQWIERHTELMDVPSVTAPRGSTVVMHTASATDGLRVVESVGQGRVVAEVVISGDDPFMKSRLTSNGRDFDLEPLKEDPRGRSKSMPSFGIQMVMAPPPSNETLTEAELAMGSFPTSKPTGPALGEKATTGLDTVWETRLVSVAVFEPSTGIMSERVWICAGTPVSTGEAGVAPYLHQGRLRQLSPDERPDVGPSAQVAWPGQAMEGLPPWPDLEG